jgi:hypothetical protein
MSAHGDVFREKVPGWKNEGGKQSTSTEVRKRKKVLRCMRRGPQKGRIVARSFSQTSRVMMYELMHRVFGEGITCSQAFVPFL